MAYTWTRRLCHDTLKASTPRWLSVRKYRHFKQPPPKYKQTAEDKFHVYKPPAPDVGQPSPPQPAESGAAAPLTKSLLQQHSSSTVPQAPVDKPPTFGCPKKRNFKAADNKWFNWWCPFCLKDIPVKGHSKGLFWRRKHLTTIHSKTLQDCPSQGRAELTKRAILRAKQMQQLAPQDAQQDVLHVKQNKLQDCVPAEGTVCCEACC